MTRISVLGGTGYAGGAIAREAAARGHDVTAFSRTAGPPAPGVVHVAGSALVRADLDRAVKGADVIVNALAPSGDLETTFIEMNGSLSETARATGARLCVVGGAGSLLVTPDGPQVYETPEFPAQFRGYARISDEVLRSLRAQDPGLDWFVLSPPRGFGHYAPGERTGQYRLGGDVLLADAAGRSYISGADFAAAFVDEIERPAHRCRRFTVAY